MINKIVLLVFVVFLFVACTSNEKLDSKCYEIPQTGKCKAMFTKSYFNQEEKSCKEFIWGGCGGNVPFESLDKCKKSCEK